MGILKTLLRYTIYWTIFFIILFWILVLITESYSISYADSKDNWAFTLQNDYFVPKGLDRYLTNAFNLTYQQFSFGNEMYTPTKKRFAGKPVDDRPWSGYTYLGYSYEIPLEKPEEKLIIQSRIGLVGNASGTKALQRFVHDDLGLGAHPAWAFQNPSEPTIDIIITKQVIEDFKSVFGESILKQEYGIRTGTVNDSAFINQEIKKGFGFLYPYVGLKGEAVLFDTHLDGRLFHDNLYTIDKEWFLATGRAGIEFYFPNWNHFFIDYHYEYLTQQFKGQHDRHAYGSISFGTKF